MPWPSRGVYFFGEGDEMRTDSGRGRRVVRVGTHALTTGSKSTLWGRLSQHKGQVKSGGGNHRGSIFRLLVGGALIAKKGLTFPSWGKGNSARGPTRAAEAPLECQVSGVINAMPLLWLAIHDPPGPESERGYIERNSIALLSNAQGPPLDLPSQNWLGRHSDREKVIRSGLWNQRHVEDGYDPAFLDRLEQLVDGKGAQR